METLNSPSARINKPRNTSRVWAITRWLWRWQLVTAAWYGERGMVPCHVAASAAKTINSGPRKDVLTEERPLWEKLYWRGCMMLTNIRYCHVALLHLAPRPLPVIPPSFGKKKTKNKFHTTNFFAQTSSSPLILLTTKSEKAVSNLNLLNVCGVAWIKAEARQHLVAWAFTNHRSARFWDKWHSTPSAKAPILKQYAF